MSFWASPSTDVRLHYTVLAVAASAGGCVGGDSDVVNTPLSQFQRVLVVAASAGGVGNVGKHYIV